MFHGPLRSGPKIRPGARKLIPAMYISICTYVVDFFHLVLWLHRVYFTLIADGNMFIWRNLGFLSRFLCSGWKRSSFSSIQKTVPHVINISHRNMGFPVYFYPPCICNSDSRHVLKAWIPDLRYVYENKRVDYSRTCCQTPMHIWHRSPFCVLLISTVKRQKRLQ